VPRCGKPDHGHSPQQLINGLTLGAVYALVALGYTMVYGIIGLINFAHGEVVMIGTMVAFTVIVSLAGSGMPPLLILGIGLLVAVLACMILGWALERVAYRPLRHAPRLTPLITAIGMSIVLQNVAMIIWGRNYITFPPMINKEIFEVGGASFTNVQVAIVCLAALVMLGLTYLVQRTRIGMAMRATAQNPHVALLMGVDINRVIAMAFIIGSALGRTGRLHGRFVLRDRPLPDGFHARPKGVHGGCAGRYRQYGGSHGRRLVAGHHRGAGCWLHR
jgi:branched-chain amino acid transport system permease protein